MGNNLTCIVENSGTKFWYNNGKLLRIERHDGITFWYGPGKTLHRLDGPAVIWINDENEWWINDKCITHKIVPWAEENNIDLNNLSEDDKLLIKLIWS